MSSVHSQSFVVNAHGSSASVYHTVPNKRRKKVHRGEADVGSSTAFMVVTLSEDAPSVKKVENPSDLTRYCNEIDKEKFLENIEIWVCRFLNVMKCTETSIVTCAIWKLWEKIIDKPTWYWWSYHTLAVLCDMRDQDGFRYQIRKSNWIPIDHSKPFIIAIEHNAFVAEHFPQDLNQKFCIYSTSETINSDTDNLVLRQTYFTYRKQSLEQCMKHLRQSLIRLNA